MIAARNVRYKTACLQKLAVVIALLTIALRNFLFS